MTRSEHKPVWQRPSTIVNGVLLLLVGVGVRGYVANTSRLEAVEARQKQAETDRRDQLAEINHRLARIEERLDDVWKQLAKSKGTAHASR